MEDQNTNHVPLIVRQRPRTVGSTSKPIPYQPPADTYELFSNPKSPFLQRLIATPTGQTRLSSEKLQSLFEKMQERGGSYHLAYPSAKSAHEKRRIASETLPGKSPTYGNHSESYEAPQRLQHFVHLFTEQVLIDLREDPFSLPKLVQDLAVLFEDQNIRIRVYDAYRTFKSFDQLLDTLTRISEDSEIENFELFCSALVGFYSQLQQ
jgi:hypothetical protein